MNSSPPRAPGATPLPMGFGEFVALMAALMATNALGIDSMLPALPAISRSLGITVENQQQWIIACYMIGFGLAQIIFGPLSDRYGRKPVILAGLLLYAAACLAASAATSFSMMLTVRVLQGMAAASTRVLAISIVRDCYTGRQMARVMSLTMIVFLAAPILAPSIGQLILLIAPWRAIFDLLALFSFATAIWLAIRLPETLHPEYRRPLAPSAIWSAVRDVLTNRFSLGYTLAMSFLFGSLMGFINSAQQVFTEALGAGSYFVVVFAFIAAAMGIASFINSRIVERLGSRMVSHVCVIGFTAVTGFHTLWSLLIGDSIVSFALFQFVTMFFFGCIGANFGAMAMEPMGAIAGTASSVQGSISTLLAAAIGLGISQLYNGSEFPIVAGFFICGIACLIVVFITEGGKLFRPHTPATAQ